MELMCELLLFIDSKRYLYHMKLECEKFIGVLNEKTITKYPPMRYHLDIDVMELLDWNGDVGLFLLKEPLKFQRYCNYILHSCLIATDSEIGRQIQQDQCVVLIRLKSVSNILISTNSHYCNGLSMYEGVLVSIAKPNSYVYHTVWSCPEECEGAEVIFSYIPKNPPRCYVCRSILFENSSMRRCGDQVSATFKLKGSDTSKTFQINDDLISKLRLGSKYVIHTIVFKKLTIVWSLEELMSIAAPLTTPIPNDINELYEQCNRKPWKFIYCLASTIGANICPLHCFLHLKMSLLMSLSSVKANPLTGSDLVHVLVAGYDTRFVGEIMRAAGSLASASATIGPCSSVPLSLLASSGGVCLMPLPLHTYNQKQIQTVLCAVESCEVTQDAWKTKLRCAVWAQGMDFKKIILHNIAGIFGTVTRGDFCEDTDDIIDFVLQRSMEPSGTTAEEIQAMRDVAIYLDLTAGIEVRLDYAAEQLIQSYFLAARKEGPRGVSVGSIKALVAMCVASARLCRRAIANTDDAILAIWLHASGCPEPRFVPQDYLQTPDNIKKLETMINNFKDWLQQFTGCSI